MIQIPVIGIAVSGYYIILIRTTLIILKLGKLKAFGKK